MNEIFLVDETGWHIAGTARKIHSQCTVLFEHRIHVISRQPPGDVPWCSIEVFDTFCPAPIRTRFVMHIAIINTGHGPFLRDLSEADPTLPVVIAGRQCSFPKV